MQAAPFPGLFAPADRRGLAGRSGSGSGSDGQAAESAARAAPWGRLDYHRKGYGFGPPKSKAGVRTVPFPELILPDLREHLHWVPFPGSLVFSTSTGTPISHSNFRQRVWLPALAVVGLDGVHFHDLRHTGNQMTADAGANLKELMARMGQDSERAALIYLHSSAERQRALADEVGRMATARLAKSKAAKPSGTQRARKLNEPGDSVGSASPDLGE